MLRYAKVLLTVAAIMLPATSANAIEWHPDCRGYGAEMTVRCAAAKQDPPGGTAKAVSVWACESGAWTERYHSDPYHGPFQYLQSTFLSQWARLNDVRRWYDLSPNVHDPRSNIVVAVSWAARFGWGPWSCA